MVMTGSRGWFGSLVGVLLVLSVAAGCRQQPAGPSKGPTASPTAAPDGATSAPDAGTAAGPAPSGGRPAAGASQVPGPPEAGGWQSVFNGKNLDGWKVTDFTGTGKVEAKDGQLILHRGQGDLTGVTWAGKREDLPQVNYEIALEAMRVDGDDFFCGLTFPVKKDCISLIVGGWGGSLVGLSSLDGYDASENETTRSMTLEKGRWYRIRVKVTAAKIEAWIDDEQVVDCEIGERKISVRWEVEPSQPLGVAGWQTKAAIRHWRLRRLPADEIEAAAP
jgi:hypothetical protein